MCENDELIAMMVIHICLKRKKEKEKKTKPKRMWMKEWLMRRNERSHVKLLKVFELSDSSNFKNFLRMDEATYNCLLQLVTPAIIKKDTVMRDAITPNERLSATLRFLASGQSFEDLKFLTNISPQSLGMIIMETCSAIIASLKSFIKMPANAEEWKAVAANFEEKWNFHKCIGAIDGKHVTITKPSNSGSYYFNYKKTFSIVLMAMVNANYEFLTIEVGINGRVSDAGVFGQSKLKGLYDDGSLNLPHPDLLPQSDAVVPYVLVGDDAFPLLENLMKPYSRQKLTKEEQVFNYRLSRARRVVENAFGIMANRFRVLHTTINLSPDKVSKITAACCYLHNFLKHNNENIYLRRASDEDNIDNNVLLELEPMRCGNASTNAKTIRNTFCSYFNNAGAVDFQNKFV